MPIDPQNDRPELAAPFRFSILRLLILTAVAAGLIAYVRASEASPALKIFVFVYFAGLLGWVVLRLPAVIQSILAHRRRLREFRERREELRRQYGSKEKSEDK